MKPFCTPLESASANIFRVPPRSRTTKPQDLHLGRFVPGAPRHPLSPPWPVLRTPSAVATMSARTNSGPLTQLPKPRPAPALQGFFQEMAPLQHPSARSPPRGGGSPAAAPAGSPAPAASRKRGIPGKSGFSFPSCLGSFFPVSH